MVDFRPDKAKGTLLAPTKKIPIFMSPKAEKAYIINSGEARNCAKRVPNSRKGERERVRKK
jgi:hypothetical protein